MVDRETGLEVVLGHHAVREDDARVVDQDVQAIVHRQEPRRAAPELLHRGEIDEDQLDLLAPRLLANVSPSGPPSRTW